MKQTLRCLSMDKFYRLICVDFALLALALLFDSAASAATAYVSQTSPNPTSPYSSWATAAHTIQDALDAVQPGDTVLVTNGIYASGGRAVDGLMTNRVVVGKPLVVISVNGPQSTIIEGRQVPTNVTVGAIRCVYLTNGAVLSGFTL